MVAVAGGGMPDPSWAARVAMLLVRAYRRILSPWLPPLCRFHPGCSQYALEALQLHGLVRGGALTLRRVLRCNPWSRGGFDPVPRPPQGPA